MGNIFTFPLKLFNWIILSSSMSVILIFLILVAKNIFKYKLGAKWHYYIWFILVIRMILPWAPESSYSIFNVLSFEKQTAIIQTTNQNNHNVQVKIVTPAAAGSINKSNKQTGTVAANVSQNKLSSNYVSRFTINLKTLCCIWLSGVFIIGLYILLNSISFEIRVKKHNSAVNGEILNIFLDCKHRLNVFENIPLITTRYVKTPTLVGFIRPCLLLPVNVLTAISLEQLNYVFIHELVHFKRKDIAINLLTTVILILHWFNPVVWYAFYKMKEDQEVSCDALVLSCIDQSELKEYALTLIKLVEKFSRSSRYPRTASIGGTKPQIIKRIKMIKSYKKYSLKWSIIGFIFMIIFGITSLTNPTAGILNAKAQAGPDSSAHIKAVASALINDYSYHPENQDEKSIAYTITKYINSVGNMDYRTVNGKEGIEYLIPARQIQESSWVENTISTFRKNKLVYYVKDLDIEFVFLRSEEATACMTGKISRTSESSELLNIYGNKFRTLLTLKKIGGKWLIATAPNKDNLIQMTLLPSYEETAIRKVINKYISSNYTDVKNTTLYIPPVTASTDQITVKCMININRAKKLDELNIINSEQEFILKKIDGNWIVSNLEIQK